MPTCQACGASVGAGATFCPACGTELVGPDGEADSSSVRDDWWPIVLALPVVLPLFGISTLMGAVWLPLWLLYPYALRADATYVRETSTTWAPDERVVLGLGAGVFLTLGVLSYLVTPWYLYRRHTALAAR